jgi:hypothetical protein
MNITAAKSYNSAYRLGKDTKNPSIGENLDVVDATAIDAYAQANASENKAFLYRLNMDLSEAIRTRF